MQHVKISYDVHFRGTSTRRKHYWFVVFQILLVTYKTLPTFTRRIKEINFKIFNAAEKFNDAKVCTNNSISFKKFR